MERRHAEDLSFGEFFHRYALTHTPVIITGVVEHMTPQPWSLDYIKQVIASCVRVRDGWGEVCSRASAIWVANSDRCFHGEVRLGELPQDRL